MLDEADGKLSAALRADLLDFYEDYADRLDAGDLEAMPGFFTEDALYRVISVENYDEGLAHAPIYCRGRVMIEDRIQALRKAALYQQRQQRHFISGLRALRGANGTIESRANFLIVEAMIEQEPQLLMVGRYVDRVVESADGFRFAERSCVYDNYRIRTTLAIPV